MNFSKYSKITVFTFILGCISLDANSSQSNVPLQELVDAQETVTITPVVFNGMIFDQNDAGDLCSGLGFQALAGFELEDCDSGETFYTLGKRGILLNSKTTQSDRKCVTPVAGFGEAFRSSFWGRKLKSITCVK